MNLWLDDVRPAPPGWTHVKTVDAAKAALMSGNVSRASLDHDLGWCESCRNDTAVRGYAEVIGSCEHIGTGYSLVCWMEETGNWPREKPTVHSANPVGAARMRQAIDRRFQGCLTRGREL